MAAIYKEFPVNVPWDFAWAALKDVGAVHTRLAQGFVTDTVLADGIRTVTFANGVVAREQIVAIDDEHRRLAYSSVGGRASHHNAYFQVLPGTEGQSRVLWVTDLLPDELRAPIAQMVELGASAIQRTLEQSYKEVK
jgi:carbon monoxide dehydrogenase subunit G